MVRAYGRSPVQLLKDIFVLSHLIKVRDWLNYRDNMSVAVFTLSAVLIGSASGVKQLDMHKTVPGAAAPQVAGAFPQAETSLANTPMKQNIRTVSAIDAKPIPILTYSVKKQHVYDIKYTASNATLKTMAGPYVYDVKRAAEKHHMSPRLIASVVYVETTGKRGIRVSRAGAIGPMQLMPKTAWDKLHVNPWNPEQNINGGTYYLSELVGRYHSLKMALIAYNEGPTAVDLGHIDEQSVEYADKILALAGGDSVEQVRKMPS